MVVTMHDLSWERVPEAFPAGFRRYARAFARRSVRRAVRVIAVSESTARDLRELYRVPHERLRVVPNGVEPDLPGRSVLGFLACGAVVRRSAFVQAGGFDPVVHFGGEEERLALDLTGGVVIDALGISSRQAMSESDAATRAAERKARPRIVFPLAPIISV